LPTTNLAADLAACLGDRYVLQRELGRGGMAIVFLARDLRHDRLVALKTLRPELLPALGSERFLREIQIAARLQHPNILPLHDSGEADGLLYYVMPYVEGESLRARLDREGQLPIEDALEIACQVAAALAYAHSHDVVHRDIKPGNILLTGDTAVVADFGIAKAITAAGGERLTDTGLAVGTAAYMSPEQAAAEPRIDGRSDIYSLGCVAYETLVGEPPFTGPTAQAVLARKLTEPPRSLRTVRESVPESVERVIIRALAKSPADRFASATAFAAALSTSLEAASAYAGPTAKTSEWVRRVAPRKRVFGSIGILFALAIVGALTLPRWHRPPAATLDPKVVAVVPFRVTGADSSLWYLREGMLDLLATKLSGTKELRTVDPRTLLRAWQNAGGSATSDIDSHRARRLTRQLGAGRLLEGEVIGTPRQMVLNARLSGPSGEEVRASVEGSSDSLTSLVDQLGAQLLILGAGEQQHRLASLTTTSLPALRAYLDGRAALRQGDFSAAHHHFAQAIELDSTFALAGIWLTWAGRWAGLWGAGDLAWRHRHRLSPRDLPILHWLENPEGTNADVQGSLIRAEAVVRASPDSPEAWSILGDWIYHWGGVVGMPDAMERSLRAYRRTLELDPEYVPSLEHLHEIHYIMGDTAEARRAISRRLPLDSTSPWAAAARWFAQTFLGDTAAGEISIVDDSLLARPDRVVNPALAFAGGFADAETLLAVARSRATTDRRLRSLQGLSWGFYLNRGQPQRAQVATGASFDVVGRVDRILDALFADGDSTAAAKLAAGVPRSSTGEANEDNLWEQYAVAQYDLTYGKAATSRAAVRAWRRAGDRADIFLILLLDAQLAARDRRADALSLLVELDSLLQTGQPWSEIPIGNLVTARLWHERGDPVRALATIRRRVVGMGMPSTFATSLRDEGRYAALAGDREGAIKAYRHYLALRSDAEPHLQPQVRAVRAELAALEREPTDR
jgi:tetratricopeptide (TPR) repeat protein/TolB-like protein